MLRLRYAGTIGLFAVGLASACDRSPSNGPLPNKDFQKPDGFDGDFDRNTIIDDASFTDTQGLDTAAIQRFFHKTPYDYASFLETYQSNGVQAADAVTRAGRAYGINPLVFVVYAELAQGLVAAQTYPFPPNRVEYVFGCGCESANDCLPELAGFDRQVDCLGRALRKALDDAKTNGSTTGGWGVDTTSVTLDGLKVTPSDESTAVLYDHTPLVNEGHSGGMWLFWNLFNLYGLAMDYAGPIGGTGAGNWIGDECTTSDNCGFDDATCATEYPAGLCTTPCDGDCPDEPDKPSTFCVDFSGQAGFCFEVCNPGAAACRDGYTCQTLHKYKGDPSDSQAVCFPAAQQ